MIYTYCREVTELTDAEIVAVIRHLRCCDSGEVTEGAMDMLRLRAECDLSKGHSGPHAGFQVSGRPSRKSDHLLGPELYGWLFWGGAVRELAWPSECPAKRDGHSCFLFDGHEGSHLHYSGEENKPAWLRHHCPTKPAA